ncbi:putative acetyltransferase [Allocatelliglobosispora scoriae]|uniref:Putative acetyltransferase n=1 Tax=Allocatelliglobosispora scoriae TaxID=643052 RepID=A0A841C0K0_9ACTN|nr:N-acetyltransferase [Allocatelliglobosispora scoriae]MBB5873268.1 putative acetyltransferase [Allocatelliglobosispora scoriae]
MLIRRETPADIDAIRTVTAAAFQRVDEAALVDALRADDTAWLPALSLVAVSAADGSVVGHVLATRATVDGVPVLGLGPVSVRPDHQGRGVGSALVHAVLGAADALDEPLVALLGSRDYYTRFGFRLAADFGITPPVAEWTPHFQVRALAAHDPRLRGTFAYADAFDDL